MTVEAFCLASGPSLTLADVDRVRAWRAESDERLVIVANTTFRIALWADVLYSMDAKWWNVYAEEARTTFKGQLATCSQAYLRHKLFFVPSRYKWSSYGNTGAGCINLMRHRGAKRIYLLGYDCQRTDGKAHHHGDHPPKLGNASSMHSWPDQFKRLASTINHKGVSVINCSRQTALKVWPRMTLEEALAKASQAA